VSAATVLLVSYNLIARLYSRETAFLVCLGLAFNHIFLLCSYTASTDMFFNLVALLALSLLLRSDDLRLWEIAGAGALTGFAYITRYNGLSFYLAVAVGLLFLNIKEVAWKKRILAFGVFLAGSLLFAGPWGIYTWLEAGRPFANNNHLNIAYEMFGKGKMSWDEYSFKFSTQFHSYLDVFAYNPGVFITQLATNAYEHFWNDLRLLIGLPIGVFTLAGIVAVFSQKSTRKQVMYFVYGIAFYLILLPVFYGERFSLYLAPTLILLAVLFFQWRKIPTIGFPGFGLAHVVLYGVLLYSSIGAIQKLSDEIGSGPAEILQIRDAFRERFPAPAPGTTIVARKPQIAYYLDMTFVPFPYVESIDSLLAECRKARAQYLYYSVIEAGMRPQFRYLLDPRRAPPSLRAVVQTTYPPSVLYFIEPR
jgi:4-amino-4-deoxy-L-arabinose transferase-like glycosyltransferase